MAITATSTLTEIRQQYLDNLHYSTPATARLFIEACHSLLMQPIRSKTTRSEVEYSPQHLRDQLQRAEQWLSQNASGSTGGTRYADFRDFRS